MEYSTSAESLDELEKMVVPLFMNIENKNVQKLVTPGHPWGPEQLERKIYSVPISDIRYMLIHFPLPSPIEYYKAAVSTNAPTHRTCVIQVFYNFTLALI